MAMIQCPECKQSVSDQAPNCPHCGFAIAARPPYPQQPPPPPPPYPQQQYPPPPAPAKKRGCLKIGCAVLAGLFLIGLIASLLMDGPSGTSSSSSSSSRTSTSTASATAPPAEAPGSQWSYDKSEDSMAKGTVSEASVKSTNTVNFRFPYAGDQHGTLILRTHPRFGRDVIFSIEKGQIPCPSYSPCRVLVRFDDAAPVNYSAVGPEDNSTETVFIRDYSGFVSRMMKAKKVRISANIYQEGAPVFEFDVTGFDQAKYRIPGK